MIGLSSDRYSLVGAEVCCSSCRDGDVRKPVRNVLRRLWNGVAGMMQRAVPCLAGLDLRNRLSM